MICLIHSKAAAAVYGYVLEGGLRYRQCAARAADVHREIDVNAAAKVTESAWKALLEQQMLKRKET